VAYRGGSDIIGGEEAASQRDEMSVGVARERGAAPASLSPTSSACLTCLLSSPLYLFVVCSLMRVVAYGGVESAGGNQRRSRRSISGMAKRRKEGRRCDAAEAAIGCSEE